MGISRIGQGIGVPKKRKKKKERRTKREIACLVYKTD
jgi:hypothetical protein